MQQRSQNQAYSRKNSTYEHQTSTREQIIGREEYRTKPKHRKSLDLSKSRSSPPQVNTHTSKNYKRQGLKIQQLEQKNANLEKQLSIERKKNIRLKKIISSKIDKERELEVAYRGIAIQLKKQMKLSPLCFCKSKNNSEKLIDSKNEERLDLKLQTSILNEQKKLLMQEIQNLKKHLSKLVSVIGVNQRQKIKSQQFQPNSLNKNHQNESKSACQPRVQSNIEDNNRQKENPNEQVKKQEITIQRQNNLANRPLNQIIKQSSFELRNSLSQKDRLSLIHEKIDSAQSRQSFKTVSEPNRGSRELNRQSLSKQELPAIQEHLNQKQNNSELFSKFLSQYQKHKQEKLIVRQKEHDCSFRTVREMQQDSFQSIVTEKPEQNWQKDRCPQVIHNQVKEHREQQFKTILNGPNFADVSSVLDISSKSMNISQHQLQYILKDTTKNRKNSNSEQVHELKRQIFRLEEANLNIIGENNSQLEQERQAYFNFMQVIRIFVNRFGIILEQLGNKHKIKFQTPQIKSIAYIVSSKAPLNEILPGMSHFNQKAELFLKNLINNIQLIGNSQRKELERKLNNLNLQQSDLKRKLNQTLQIKETKEKSVQQLKSRINMLQYELSCRPLDSQSLEEKQKSNFIREVMKQKYCEQQPKLASSQTQCQIISVQNMKKLQNFIQNLPIAIKRFLQKKKIKDAQFLEIKLQGNLQNQFHQIFDKAFNSIENSRSPQAEQQLINRKYSLSLKDIGEFPKKIDKPEIDIQNYYQMQAQLKQLEVKLKQKEEIIERMKKIIANEKRQSLLKQQELKKIIKSEPKIEQFRRDYLSSLQGTHIKPLKPMIDPQSTPQFRQYSEIKQFNNLSLGKDEVVKELKQKIEVLQKQVEKYKAQGKKKKILYVNH